MSCNGNNHDFYCPCEFRGGHGGGFPSIGSMWNRDFYPYDGSICESYITETNCPECGDAVIFYRSPYDGRVFFDPPIGYPWPKHPCTDSSLKGQAAALRKVQKEGMPFLQPGWDLFAIHSVNPRYMMRYLRSLFHPDDLKNWVEDIEIVGTLVRIRKKRKIKVLKKGASSETDGSSREYEVNSSFQITLKIKETTNWLKRWDTVLTGGTAFIKLRDNDPQCDLSWLSDSDGSTMKIQAEIVRIRDLQPKRPRTRNRRDSGGARGPS